MRLVRPSWPIPAARSPSTAPAPALLSAESARQDCPTGLRATVHAATSPGRPFKRLAGEEVSGSGVR